MDRGLLGGDVCGEANMIAVSNPCRLDASLAPPGKIVVHAYSCGNEPYEAWEHLAPDGYGPSGGLKKRKKKTGEMDQRDDAAVEGSKMAKGEESTDGKEKEAAAAGDAYEALKIERAEVLWRAVERIIPDARARAELELIGSPLTHQRFLRRPRGTYGATFADALPDCATPINNLVLCGDSVVPGIGVPAVALNGASAANTLMGPLQHWMKVSELIEKGLV
jgi:phytoene dehydrogenase-like protein